MLSTPFHHTRSLRRWLLVIGLLIAPLRTAAAQSAHTLVVTIHDSVGTALSGVSIQLRSSDDESLIAQGVTDTSGRAVFRDITVTALRVVVRGTLAEGTPLVQPGQDAHGIALFFTSPSTTLELIVAPNGIVAPDPAALAERATPTVSTHALESHIPARTIWPFLAIAGAGVIAAALLIAMRRGRRL